MAKKPLRWSKKQKKIYDCLTGGMKPAQIAKTHKIAFSSITDVKHAIAKGETPYATQATIPKVKQAAVMNPEVAPTDSEIEELKAQVKKLTAILKGEEEPEEAPIAPASEAVALKFQITPETVEVSPLMMNAMKYYVQEKGFPADGTWTDFIDTIFYQFFLDQGIYMAPWYDINNLPTNLPSKPAWGKPEGSDKVDSYNPDLKKLAEQIVIKALDIVQKQKYQE